MILTHNSVTSSKTTNQQELEQKDNMTKAKTCNHPFYYPWMQTLLEPN